MLFNSIDFALFLPIVFLLYWLVFGRQRQKQNFLILIASYVFYGWWDVKFLGLIVLSTLVDFLIGKKMENVHAKGRRKLLLWISLSVNLGLLGFFKYYNFFIESFLDAFTLFGFQMGASTLNIVLPVGISFYTFQTLSYTIDVYKRKIPASNDLVSFGAFVSFFPQLVAGPIERASHLLPQFQKPRSFEYSKAVDGLRQILWGLFKKIVIADNAAAIANEIFNHSGDMNGSTLIIGAVFFAFQIYGDFSGYSDIAIGTARLFGFDLMQNFAFPYFSRNIAEFWRRWHISLSTWFRDYLYIPLGGSRGGKLLSIRNIFIVFLVSGFWHGANWTFVVWGGLNALYFLPVFLMKKNRNYVDTVAENSKLPSLKELGQILGTFAITVIAWIYFRAENLSHAHEILTEISRSACTFPALPDPLFTLAITGLVIFFILCEWNGRKSAYGLEGLFLKSPRFVRIGFYYGLASAVIWFAGNNQEFIYFQF